MTGKKSGGLGRGLGAILADIPVDSNVGTTTTAAISMIKVDKIVANPYQPRKEFDDEALQELSQSIRQQGIISPITVRKMEDDTYQLIAGERRLRASKLAGVKEIPAYIRVATDSQMMEMALVENIQRENLNAIEVALAYKALIEECRLTHEALSERVGKNRSTITNYLRLLNLPAETQLALSSEQISMAHARALLSVEDIDKHLAILHDIIEKHLSVHQTEELCSENKPEHKKTLRQKEELPENYILAQNSLKEYLQSAIEIKRSKRGKGTLTIAFNSDSDFERIVSLLKERE